MRWSPPPSFSSRTTFRRDAWDSTYHRRGDAGDADCNAAGVVRHQLCMKRWPLDWFSSNWVSYFRNLWGNSTELYLKLAEKNGIGKVVLVCVLIVSHLFWLVIQCTKSACVTICTKKQWTLFEEESVLLVPLFNCIKLQKVQVARSTQDKTLGLSDYHISLAYVLITKLWSATVLLELHFYLWK